MRFWGGGSLPLSGYVLGPKALARIRRYPLVPFLPKAVLSATNGPEAFRDESFLSIILGGKYLIFGWLRVIESGSVWQMTRIDDFWTRTHKNVKQDRSSKRREKKRKTADRAVWWKRWTNTLLVTILTPVVVVGSIYLLLFFILNSSYGPAIFHAQLSQFLRGDFFADTLSTDALLRRLTLTNVRLSEAGHDDAVVFAPRLEAKIPIEELVDLVTDTTLRLGRITAYEPEVLLDFSRGELNILKVVLPYFSAPEPPDPTPGNFVTFLSDLNVQRGNVHLVFDGFRIDLSGVDVDHYALRAGAVLTMTSPTEEDNNGKRAVRVDQTTLKFNPALFSFALASVGDADEGLVMSGGAQAAGKLGYAFDMMSRSMANMLRPVARYADRLGEAPDMRGEFVVSLQNTEVDGFHWKGNTMEIPLMESRIGDGGTMRMVRGMMNVGPTQTDIDDMQIRYNHMPSGLLPEESLLWSVERFDLDLGVEDPILTYFVGHVLHGKTPFHLQARMRGDLARVSGDIALDVTQFDTFDIDVDRVALRAYMDGQRVTIHALEAETVMGSAAVAGFYDIMDGNFDIDLWTGNVPDAERFAYISKDFGQKLAKGMIPLAFLPDGPIKRVSGTLSTHLKATSQDGKISAWLPDPLVYKLDEPLMGVQKFQLSAVHTKSPCIATYQGDLIESPAGIHLAIGDDAVRIAPGLRVNLDDLLHSKAELAVHVADPALYAQAFGVEQLSSGPFDLELSYDTCQRDLCGNLKVQAHDIQALGVEVPSIDIDVALDHSQVKTRTFAIQSNMLNVGANLTGQLSQSQIMAPTTAPFRADVEFTDIDLESMSQHAEPHIPALASLGLKGKGAGTLRVDGPIDKIKANFIFNLEDFEAMEVPASRISLFARYENHNVTVPALNIWFAPAELQGEEAEERKAEIQAQIEAEEKARAQTQSPDDPPSPAVWNERRVARAMRRTPDFSINTLTYNLDKNTVIFNVSLLPTSPNDFKPFRDLNIPLQGQAALDLAVNLDLNWILNGGWKTDSSRKNAHATWIEGDILLTGLQYADFTLGNIDMHLSRSAQYTLIKGNFFDIFGLSGFVRTYPRLTASLAFNFPDLAILDTLKDIGIDMTELANAFNIRDARIAGSIGVCMASFDDIRLSVILDTFEAGVFGYPMMLAQPAFIRLDVLNMAVTLNALELKYRDSVLKLSGSGDADGRIDVDVNGEIDAALARSFVSSVSQSTGLLAVNVSAHGNLFHNGKFSLNDLDLEGYLGVRDPIQIQTQLTHSPLELPRGFLLIDNHHPRCAKNEICLYTPDDQPFTLGINDQWVKLSLFAGTHGDLDTRLSGKINAAIAQLFVKDMSDASGLVDLDLHVSGKFVDKAGNVHIDLARFDADGHVAIEQPISLELRSLNDPITVDDGIVQIADGAVCPSKQSCIVIPKDRAFQGSLMGGNYLIFGEIVRDVFIPKSGNLTISANDLGFRMKDELAITVSPDIQITATDLANFETVKIGGDIEISEAKYHKNFDDGSSNFLKEQILSVFVDSRRRSSTYSPSFLRKMPDLGKIRFDVGVTAENSINVDVQIAGAKVELELGTQTRIGGTLLDIAPTGIFAINSGLFSMSGNDFDFQNGSQIAFNGSLDGKIDITASAEINTDSSAFGAITGNTDLDRRKRVSTSSSNASSDMYSITLTVAGSLFAPTWSFESSPYLSDANIYALILTGKTIEDFSGNDIAMESLLSPFFSSQLDNFINADQFKFLFTEGAAQFVYVKQITKALRIAAGVSIRGSDGNEQALSAEYYFNDNWFIDLTGQNTSDEVGRAPTFKLGARLHWHLALE